MTTRKELNDRCRLRLGDTNEPYVFSDQQINRWINDAIADYSLSFPRVMSVQIPASAGERCYPLQDYPALQHVVRVEYPYGCEPPRCLLRRSEDDRRGFLGREVYDLKVIPPQTPCLILGCSPAEGEVIAITFQADHSFPENDEDVLSVPDRHLELLILFVRMASMQEQYARHSAEAESGSILLSTLSENTARAIREYREKLEQTLLAQDACRWADWKGADRV